jgi:uncharacterized protein YndB with AHSA1/START domain
MADIRHYLVIRAPKEKIYKAVTEQEGLAGWWTPTNTARPEAGSVAVFDFGDRYHNEMRIALLEPGERVEWECLEGDKEWIGTRFHFDIEAKEDHCILRFGHTGWREATDFFANCNYHWGFYMRSLKKYCETGMGEPFSEGD